MTVYDIIEKKKRRQILTREEIRFLVKGYTDGSVPDYQMSAFFMAVCFAGMTEEETFALTQCMKDSGKTLDLSEFPLVADNQSSGGVGDTTTLVLAPLLACLGFTAAKLSGRGLGHTGGTLDKLESIRGVQTNLSDERFRKILRDAGCCICAQTQELVPADKKMYALRDVTATVDSIPLIAASIMSKKLAGGANYLLLDVKCGSGAFMKTKKDALKLAQIMVNIGNKAGKDVCAFVTDMSQPLSRYVGNAPEILGALEVMDGKPSRLADEVKLFALTLAMRANVADAEQKIETLLKNGEVKKRFAQMIALQGGDADLVFHPERIEIGIPQPVYATRSGYLSRIDTETVGKVAALLGGGRQKIEDEIDPSVGLKMEVEQNDFVQKGERIATIYHRNKNLSEAEILLSNAFHFSARPTKPLPLFYAFVDENGVSVHETDDSVEKPPLS